MALTKYEALARCGAIWGKGGIVERNTDGSIMFIDGFNHAHRLDSNGHPVCHRGCRELETQAYQHKILV